MLARLIAGHSDRWNGVPTEDPIWGLIRVVIAQQISTSVASQIAERVSAIASPLHGGATEHPTVETLRSCGMTNRKAETCAYLLAQSEFLRTCIHTDPEWDDRLLAIPGIGPWTIDMLRILVLKEPDVLPSGDLGLRNAVKQNYGTRARVDTLAKRWSPYRSVACWYLWRSLGNVPLG